MSNEYDPFFSWKALAWPDQCRAIAAGQIPWPVQMSIYPTNRCNRNCRGCIMAAERHDGAELAEGVFAGVITQANRFGTKSIHIAGGGEPTMYPYLRHAAAFGGMSVLSTNGTLLDRRICSWFNRIRVSVNAGTAAGYSSFTGCEASQFALIVSNLKQCCERPRPWSIGLGLVGDMQSAEEIAAFVTLADSVGADWVHIRPCYYPPQSPNAGAVAAHWPFIAAAATEAANSARCKVFCVSDKFDGHWTPRGFSKCRATPLVAVVCADARLAVCQDVFIKWGDLNRQTFSEAWQSHEHYAAMRQIDVASCPRCIMGRHNEVVEHCFINNECMLEVL